jgi:hypothetical protein
MTTISGTVLDMSLVKDSGTSGASSAEGTPNWKEESVDSSIVQLPTELLSDEPPPVFSLGWWRGFDDLDRPLSGVYSPDSVLSSCINASKLDRDNSFASSSALLYANVRVWMSTGGKSEESGKSSLKTPHASSPPSTGVFFTPTMSVSI